ncbi:MAG: KEOPS complex kinase/ATPase Bud32 [Candidatus Woesearchaeota archaeon]
MLKIAQGAEAILYRDNNTVIKERFNKKYRLAHLDESLRKFRTRREAKILGRLEELNFPAPHLIDFSDKRMSITMDFVPGEKLRDVLNNDNYLQFAENMGEKIGELHVNNIIHGDLTTSNMIVEKESGKLNFLDFGLSSFSDRVEDKAVDLFLLDRALESKHYLFYPQIFEKVIESYQKNNIDASYVLERFNVVRGRGRNKNKN